MTTEFRLINDIFIEWNPIEVPPDVAEDEYIIYVVSIIENRKNIIDIVSVLQNILINEIGLNYSPENVEHKKEIVYYGYKMYLALN